MRKTDYIPIVMVAALGGFIASQIMRAPRRPKVQVVEQQEAPVPTERAETKAAAAASAAYGRPPKDVAGLLRMSAAAPPERNVEDIRRRVRWGEPGTYIAAALKQQDSAVYRWPERIVDPIRVWVAPAPVPNSDELLHLVRDAFGDWGAAGIPVRFTFVVDRQNADVNVNWIERWDTGIRVGYTKVVYDQHRWLLPGAEITLATHHTSGRPVQNATIRSIAVHEVGHLLGLPHSADSTDLMFSTVYASQLTRADLATMRLVYSIPPGSIK